jgi:anaerobic dimethyl sulfoxide reductase subunit C (anchor subunit)
MSIGIIVCATLVAHFCNGDPVFLKTGLNPGNPVFLALVLIGIATFISFLHLGSPSNAPNSLNNLSGSWLSREILAIGVYSLSLLLVLLPGWHSGYFDQLKPLLILSSACGLILLWMMTRIYVQPTIPPWNSWFTPLSFISTALCLGLLTFLVFRFTGSVDFSQKTLQAFAFAIAIVLLIEIISSFFMQSRLAKMDTGIDKLVFDQGAFYRIYRVRMGILVVAFLANIFIFSRADLVAGNMGFFWLSLLSILIIGQELAGRLLFYASYFRLGV